MALGVSSSGSVPRIQAAVSAAPRQILRIEARRIIYTGGVRWLLEKEREREETVVGSVGTVVWVTVTGGVAR